MSLKFYLCLLLSSGAFAATLPGELSGPKLIRNRSKERILQYDCTTYANAKEARTVTLWVKPKGRSLKVFLGQGVTVEGTASRTRVPEKNEVIYHFSHALDAYPFQITFSTNQLWDEAELRLKSGEDSIVCHYPDASHFLSE